ncbi:MAG: dTDP-4-dehydrorhamnose reductase [Acidimicrobiia bacterium]
MRVLITGANGQMGSELSALCQSHGDEVIGIDLPDHDIRDRDAAMGIITSVRPDAVINCAAMTAVDACEGDVLGAFTSNALAVRWVAEACRRVDAHLVQISTDYVFDGSKDAPYHEWDVPNPKSVYGASKLAGEREAGPTATIARTSWVCGLGGNNMVKTVLRLAAEPGQLRFVSDQIGHPTIVSSMVPMLRRFAVDRRAGVYHTTNAGAVSWYEFVQEILRAAGHDPDRVQPVLTSDLQPPRPAPRPANSVLDNMAIRLGGLPPLPDFREPLAELVRALL